MSITLKKGIRKGLFQQHKQCILLIFAIMKLNGYLVLAKLRLRWMEEFHVKLFSKKLKEIIIMYLQNETWIRI